MTTLTTAETLAFATSKFSPARAAQMTSWYPQVLERIIAAIGRKYNLDAATTEDVAVAAVTYSLSYFLNGKAPWPSQMGDWTALALTKARFLALDCCARAKKGPHLQVDAPISCGDNEPIPESAVVAARSLQIWRDAREAEESRMRARAVRAVLPQVVEAMDVKDKRKTCAVFSEFYFENKPMPVVCRRHGITANHGYQIVFRVKDAYQTFGRRLVERYLDTYEAAA